MSVLKVARPNGQQFLAAGGVLTGLGAASCCVLPFALLSLGLAGAWVGHLTALAPYKVPLIALTLAFLAGGLVLHFRKSRVGAGAGACCARPCVSDRLARAGLWSATILVVATLLFPYVVPFLADL
ncbi:mercuric transporter MerT family protein [Methylobacterium sp. 092160098-2]|uniref:mercuric transporter MerT family protein n=1 Tax=Methylobacterium sp. 092160098-2 TaxID=3025129 RepID=UPI00406C008D